MPHRGSRLLGMCVCGGCHGGDRGMVRGSGRAGIQGQDSCSGRQEQIRGQLTWLCCCPSSTSVVPVWPQLLCCVSWPSASLCLQLPVLTQEAAFPILEAAFLYTTALPMLICSLGWGAWTSPSRLCLDWHPRQAQCGQHSSVFPSPSCPSGDCSQGCLYAGVLAPAWCAHAQGLPASCVSQWGRGSRAGCPGRTGAGPAGAARAAARFPHMKMFGWKLRAASCLLGAIRICRCLQCLTSSSRG